MRSGNYGGRLYMLDRNSREGLNIIVVQIRLGFIFIYKGKEFEEKFVFEVLTLCFLSPSSFSTNLYGF